MSSGPFTLTRYTTDNGDIAPIRVQPETLGLVLGGTTNAAPSGTPTPGFPSARISGSRRRAGINARRVRIRVTAAGTSGLSVGSVITLPWLQQTGFAALARGVTGTYNTATVQFVGKTSEALV